MTKIFVGSGWVQAEDGSLGGSLDGRLSGRELALFNGLAKTQGQVVAHGDLEHTIWGDATGKTRRLKALVQRLRQKVEPDPSSPVHILTALRRGYRLAAEDIAPSPRPDPIHAPPVRAPPEPEDVVLPILFGRQREQARIEEWLFRRRGSWLTLTGVGGVGKSALLDWTHARARAHGLTCRRVALAEVMTTERLLERIAHAGHIVIPPGAEPEPLLAMALRARPGLWLLDDLTQLDADAVEALDRLFSPFEAVRVLATKRHPLQSLDEVIFPLAPLAPAAAAEMFQALSGRASDPPAQLPRLPLWVRIAASDAIDSTAQITEQGLVESAIAGAPASSALELLGWHPPESDAEVLAALLGVSTSDLDAWRRRGLIEVLPGHRIRVHAVIRESLRLRSARSDRLGHHRREQLERLIRYVRVEASAAFEVRPLEVRRKVLDYLDRLLTWAGGLRPDSVDALFDILPVLTRVVIGSGRERGWIEALDALAGRLERHAERTGAARIRLATCDLSDSIAPADEQLRRLQQIEPDDLSSSDRDLRDILLAGVHARIGQQSPASDILETFEGRVDHLPPGTRVRYRIAQSANLRWQARHEEALSQTQFALSEARSSAPMMETAALLQRATALRELGRVEELEPALVEAERAARRWDDRAALAGVVRIQAQHAIGRGHAEAAIERAEAALALSHPGSSTYVRALYSTAVAHRLGLSNARSEALLHAALAAAREQNDLGLVPVLLDSLASAHLQQDDYASAITFYTQAIQAATSLGDTREAKRIHSNMAQTYLMTNDLESAARHQELGRIDGPAPPGWALSWSYRQAIVMLGMGNFARTRDALVDALELTEALKSGSIAVALAILLAEWHLKRGLQDEAVAICRALPWTPAIEQNARGVPAILREALRHPGELRSAEIMKLVRDNIQNPRLIESA